MKVKSSLEILDKFLVNQEISINCEEYLGRNLSKSNDLTILPENIVKQIIGDAFEAHRSLVKNISQEIVKTFKIYLGYVQKDQLKRYLDYQEEHDFNQLVSLIKVLNNGENIVEKKLQKICENELKDNDTLVEESVKEFLNNLKNAIKNKNSKRIIDYLSFIYSRLIARNEERKLSLHDIFTNNINYGSFTTTQRRTLDKLCNDKKIDREEAIRKFNSKYLHILDSNGDSKSSIIYLNISQKIFDKFKTKEQFYDAIFLFIKKAYDALENHKSLVIRVGNILHDNINIKWEIYSYLTIFAEKFQKTKETRPYFFPEIFCKEFLDYCYDIKISDEEINILRKYYRKEITFQVLKKSKKFNFTNSENIINEFSNVYYGFTFIDCLILEDKEQYPNSKEVSFIKNNNELLLLFLKHQIDSRKIPCPVCGSLKISGNSFPEIGIRSWECKNPFCSQRSKTNRGKRYSARTIFMQNATFDFRKENIISKKLIKKWRKDIVENQDLDSLYNMITKYYSFVDDTITAINVEDRNKWQKIANSEKRKIDFLDFEKFIGKSNERLFENFIEKSSDFKFIDNFIFEKKSHHLVKNSKPIKLGKHTIIPGDCRDVLEQIPESITNMVTSPPYYNAREYSQWDSLYQYLHEMYEMAQKSFLKLEKGGVFFFNIGDIFDNEKIVVKSKMGEKRIPLGAYIIMIFKKVGFELLDNVIWYKGEPQSQRHKNDGNYVPYYQRPTNCYEHMFVFKKPGAKLHLNENKSELIKSNIQKFVPVYKIGHGGVNHYGHTAPFPKNIPQLSIGCFTNPGEIVLDPYLGSGTTIIAANKAGRTGIGIEINSEYVDLAEKRIEDFS